MDDAPAPRREAGADRRPADPSTHPPEPSPRSRTERVSAAIRPHLERARAEFRSRVPPGWNWRRVVVGVVLGELAAVLLLLLFLAFSGKALVISFERPVPAPSRASPRLTIPVAGVLATDLVDTWGAPRTATRSHLGIDIRAAPGTPVVAAAAGTIVRMADSRDGGITIHQRALDGRTVFYYAHLQRRVAGLDVGDLVAPGDTLAYVGDSGNAEGTPHLHFAVYAVSDPNEVSHGRHMNPYPLLVEPSAPAGGS